MCIPQSYLESIANNGLTCQAMNMKFLMDVTDGKVFKIMADVTEKLLSKRMDIVVQQGMNR